MNARSDDFEKLAREVEVPLRTTPPERTGSECQAIVTAIRSTGAGIIRALSLLAEAQPK